MLVWKLVSKVINTLDVDSMHTIYIYDLLHCWLMLIAVFYSVSLIFLQCGSMNLSYFVVCNVNFYKYIFFKYLLITNVDCIPLHSLFGILLKCSFCTCSYMVESTLISTHWKELRSLLLLLGWIPKRGIWMIPLKP